MLSCSEAWSLQQGMYVRKSTKQGEEGLDEVWNFLHEVLCQISLAHTSKKKNTPTTPANVVCMECAIPKNNVCLATSFIPSSPFNAFLLSMEQSIASENSYRLIGMAAQARIHGRSTGDRSSPSILSITFVLHT